MYNARKILPEKVTVIFGRNRAGTKLVFSHTHTLLSLPNKIKILILIIYNEFEHSVIYSMHSGEGIH